MSEREKKSDQTPVKLTDCRDPYEAAAIVAALEEAGIEAIVDGELVAFNYVEVPNPPIIRVAAGDAEHAVEVFTQWQVEVQARRAERVADQNTPVDPTTDDDVYQDHNGQDGVMWDRYGRPSSIAYGAIVLFLLMIVGAILMQVIL